MCGSASGWSRNVCAAKEMLSRATTSLIHLPLLDAEAPLGREELDRLAAPVLDRTVAAVREVLEATGVHAADISAIFLAGGSSRMPAVVTSLHRAFGSHEQLNRPDLVGTVYGRRPSGRAILGGSVDS